MRSGFHKPGAIPFLALLLVSLLSLVPSLAKEWDFYNLRFGYIGSSHRNDVRQPSRIRDGPVDVRSRIRAAGNQCKSWAINGDCLSDLDRLPRPRRPAPDAPPRSSFEAATVLDNDPIAYVAEESSTFTQGVRTFKSFFIKKPGDSPLSTGSTSSVVSAPTTLTLNLSHSSLTRVSTSSEVLLSKSYSGNCTTSTTGLDLEISHYYLSRLLELWQQVCRVANGYLESNTAPYAFRKSKRADLDSQPISEETIQQLGKPGQHAEEQAAPKMLPSNGSNVALPTPSPTSPQPLTIPTHAPNSTVANAGQSKGVGQGPNSEPTRGSCMAIVIGLVVGVMWF
ncbi:hypothetical protein BBP40_003297 [Aspergillus hancockii]|nr:hypothetical protein BBP40_003297 [Aspergillus hancockii]